MATTAYGCNHSTYDETGHCVECGAVELTLLTEEAGA